MYLETMFLNGSHGSYSLAEAQKATSLVARADYALKRFLWIP